MRTIAIVQATMSLGKWYGGVLKSLAGKPVLWHVFHRARKCALLDAIAIVTTTDQLDDALELFAMEQGVDIIRTPEKSALKRFGVAACKLKGDVVVCIAGNAPFIDPVTVDKAVEILTEQDADFCVTNDAGSVIAQGFEAVSARALRKLVGQVEKKSATGASAKRSGVAPKDFPKIARFEIKKEFRLCGASMLVNSPADFAFLQAIYNAFPVEAGAMDMRDVIRLLRFRPGMTDQQKEMEDPFSNMLLA